ncbi:MAG TPA: hypothetical protein VFG03_06325 [Telluria sp.]|nr:hypothetical protein [Telluria sp.]
MNTCVYDKTDKGREEIATRKYHVPPKLRALLVMIDGRNPLDALMKNFAGLGLTEANVTELLNEQYITLVSGGPEANPAVPVAARPPASARARQQARARQAAARAAPGADGADGADSPPHQTGDEDDDELGAPHAALAGPAPLVVGMDKAERFRALSEFFNQTIKSTLGLRGLMLQLKAEKCANIDEFRLLRQPYLEAVLKAKGAEMALSLRDRLDMLLGGAPEDDGFILPDA